MTRTDEMFVAGWDAMGWDVARCEAHLAGRQRGHEGGESDPECEGEAEEQHDDRGRLSHHHPENLQSEGRLRWPRGARRKELLVVEVEVRFFSESKP